MRVSFTPFLILLLTISLGVSGLRAQQAGLSSVDEMWELFTEKCSLFIEDPSVFVQSPNLFIIGDWKWMMRGANSVGFVEYFSVSPERDQVFTAIGDATSQGYALDCSLSGQLQGAQSANDVFSMVRSYLLARDELSTLSEEVSFYGDPNMIAELKQYHSTSYIIRVEGGFANSNLVATIRSDDGNAVYFEVIDIQSSKSGKP